MVGNSLGVYNLSGLREKVMNAVHHLVSDGGHPWIFGGQIVSGGQIAADGH